MTHAVQVWRWMPSQPGTPQSRLIFPTDGETVDDVLVREVTTWSHRPRADLYLPEPNVVEYDGQPPSDDQWTDRPRADAAIADHETNPEYKMHVGQLTSDGRRCVSIWLHGQRWSGFLSPGDPADII